MLSAADVLGLEYQHHLRLTACVLHDCFICIQLAILDITTSLAMYQLADNSYLLMHKTRAASKHKMVICTDCRRNQSTTAFDPHHISHQLFLLFGRKPGIPCHHLSASTLLLTSFGRCFQNGFSMLRLCSPCVSSPSSLSISKSVTGSCLRCPCHSLFTPTPICTIASLVPWVASHTRVPNPPVKPSMRLPCRGIARSGYRHHTTTSPVRRQSSCHWLLKIRVHSP